MSIIDRLANRFGFMNRREAEKAAEKALEEIKAVVSNPPSWLRATAEYEGLQDINSLGTSKHQVSLFNRLSWVNTAVRHVAGQASVVPFEVSEQSANEEKEKIDSHELELLLQRPNPTESRYELINTTVSNYKLTGNGFWWLNKPSEFAPPEEIFTLPTHMVTPVPDGKMFLKGYTYDPGDGVLIALEPWEVVHFKQYNSLTRYWGLSEILSLAVIAVGDLAMQKHNTEFFSGMGAKLAGLLAFADPIAESDWQKMKADIKDASQKRDLMMLRNVQKGGVEWVKTGMTQAEMEFIEGRQMNKTEIWDLMAPGLPSWLAINTTEANARAGRDAFRELAVWPVLQVFQEKITNEILPLYGDNLIGEFEDIRPIDKETKIAEQTASKDIMTIDEQRKTFWGLEPIEDAELGGQIVSLANVKSDNPMPSFGNNPFEENTPEEEDEVVKYRRYVKRKGSGEDFVFRYLNVEKQDALKSQEGKTLDFLIKAIDMAKESVSV